ncbi:HEAT repeat domain-containing protein [Plesiocystis pacifica]|nr:HEAT repeat domain-containing protein [Plesiocystis pacifica]
MMDTAVLWVRAEAAMRSGRWQDALGYLRQLAAVVDRIDFEYDEWLRALAETFKRLGLFRDAAACEAYLGATSVPEGEALEALAGRIEKGDEDALQGVRLFGVYLSRAGKHDEQSRLSKPEDARRWHAHAAQWFEVARMPIHRAIELERAGQDAAAAELWAALIGNTGVGGGAGRSSDLLAERPYEQALARINYGLCLHRLGSDRARQALAEATTAVEEVADQFETEGLRERAFDCYQLLARIGLETGAFENVAEGYLNSVRILRDDALKLDALRLYEAFVTLARRAKEFHAVAGILREAADYCARAGLPYGDDLRLRAGEAWLKAAEDAAEHGRPAQIVENAYLAAAESYVSVRAFRQAAEVYRRVSKLEIKGRERYRRLLQRLGPNPEDAPRPVPVPEFLKRLPDYEEVWYVDLAEWELDGDAGLIAAGVMADRRFPDYVRRHALLLVLELGRHAHARSRGQDSELEGLEVITRLQEIRAYPVIAALERMYQRGGAEERSAVARALGALRFKRSFSTLSRALRSDHEEVRRQAAKALTNLYFPHAFDRLRRIFEARDLPDAASARISAIRAIGKINTVEALDFLCDRLREGDERVVGYVTTAIAELSNNDLAPYVRQQIDLVPAVYRSVLEDAATRLGS